MTTATARYVLGGGIAGLIWAWHHSDDVVVAESPGGASASRLPIGPRYLHVTDAVGAFLDGLGFARGEERWASAGGVPVDAHGVGCYMLKTRGVYDLRAEGQAALTSRHRVYASPTLEDVTARLLELLRPRVRVERVLSVCPERREFATAAGVSSYASLVNTVPLPMFLRLLDCDGPVMGGSYLKIPVRFDHHRLRGPWPWGGDDYVYVSSLSVPYSRATRVTVGGNEYVCLEYPGADVAASPAPESDWLGSREASVVFPYGRVVSRPMPDAAVKWFAARGIEHFGRFAEWQDHYLSHHLIGRLQ